MLGLLRSHSFSSSPWRLLKLTTRSQNELSHFEFRVISLHLNKKYLLTFNNNFIFRMFNKFILNFRLDLFPFKLFITIYNIVHTTIYLVKSYTLTIKCISKYCNVGLKYLQSCCKFIESDIYIWFQFFNHECFGDSVVLIFIIAV